MAFLNDLRDDSYKGWDAPLGNTGEVRSGAVRFWHFEVSRGPRAKLRIKLTTNYTRLPPQLRPLPFHVLVDVLAHLRPDLVRERKVGRTRGVLGHQGLGELRS